MKRISKEEFQTLLEGKNTIAISGHVRPDGDCVGSCMGLYLYLKENYDFQEVTVYLEPIPDSFSIIHGTSEIKNELTEKKAYDLFICLDCGDVGRLNGFTDLFYDAKETLCIDHHISNQKFADHNYIVPDASSTAELVFNLIETDKINKEIAEALYMGIAHDTGVFQYSCTAPSTLIAAAELLRKGIDANAITDHTFYEKTYAQNQVMGKALLESEMLLNHKCIASVVTAKDMELFGVIAKDLDGVVSQLRYTKGVEVAIFLYELEQQEYKISLRSNGKVDVSKVAQYFGGGGHIRASGCTLTGNYHDILNQIVDQVALQLNNLED